MSSGHSIALSRSQSPPILRRTTLHPPPPGRMESNPPKPSSPSIVYHRMIAGPESARQHHPIPPSQPSPSSLDDRPNVCKPRLSFSGMEQHHSYYLLLIPSRQGQSGDVVPNVTLISRDQSRVGAHPSERNIMQKRCNETVPSKAPFIAMPKPHTS